MGSSRIEETQEQTGSVSPEETSQNFPPTRGGILSTQDLKAVFVFSWGFTPLNEP